MIINIIIMELILHPASEEQRAIVECVGESNLIVDSVAGSGKTTTVLHIAKQYVDKRILLVTYNSKLRLETRDRADSLELDNITVHTYHSFGVNVISKACRTDQGLIKAKDKALIDCPKYDLIIIDEAQDMTPLYYGLIRKIIGVSPSARICVIGDRYQSIYGYAGADARFITLADRLHPGNKWSRLYLNTSYRVSWQMAEFINKCVLHEDRLVATKHGKLPKYTIYSFDNIQPARDEIKQLLLTYQPNDIFILAPSVKSGNNANPIRKLANALTKLKIPIYIPSNDSKLDDDVLNGKVVFSSFHQAKGLERKAVLVFGFDQSYFKYYNKCDDPTRCANPLYVALTRATEHLSIYQSGPTLRFVDIEQVKLYTDFTAHSKIKARDEPCKRNKIAVTKLAEHIPSEILAKCMECFDCVELRPASELLKINNKTAQQIGGKTYHEDVSDINGVAIPARYEYIISGKMSICDDASNLNRVSDLLRCANVYIAEVSAIKYKVSQIVKYDWLPNDILNLATDRLSIELLEDTGKKFEQHAQCTVAKYEINGRTDITTDQRILEIKTVNELSPENYIQLAVYAYCHMTTALHDKKYHLFNVKDNSLYELSSTRERLFNMIKLLICTKYHQQNTLSDESFLAKLQIDYTDTYECATCAEFKFS